jgi:phage terminase small subunit
MPKATSLQVDEEQDAPILKAFDAWSKVLDKAIAEVEAADALVKRTPNGLEQKIPELNILADATKQILALAAQLGRTPAARVRLGAESEPEGEDDPALPPLPVRKRVKARA